MNLHSISSIQTCAIALVVFFTVKSAAHEMRVINNCNYPVWVALLNDGTRTQVENGGFKLDSKTRKTLSLHLNWRGRLWGRTGCDSSGKCQTGDCGGRLQCAGISGESPATLAEFNFELKQDAGNLEYYDLSLVDGYNLPMTITPTGGFVSNGNGQYDCKKIECLPTPNQCPADLVKKNAQGQYSGCFSACAKFNTDQYCCRKNHDKPETCKSSDWPKNYPATFKKLCPKAYSYAYDDHKSTYTCKPKTAGKSTYDVQFC